MCELFGEKENDEQVWAGVCLNRTTNGRLIAGQTMAANNNNDDDEAAVVRHRHNNRRPKGKRALIESP